MNCQKVFCTMLAGIATVLAAAPDAKSFKDQPSSLSLSSMETAISELPVKVVLFPMRQTIISAEVESTIRSYKFKEGETFQRDEVLVNFDDRNYQQRLEKAKAAVVEAQAGYDFAIKNLKRNKEMYEKGIQGQQDVERSELERDVNLSKLNFSKANLKIAEQELAACTIKAPFNGRVVRKLIQEFEFVRIGLQILAIIDDSQLLAVMHLPSMEKNALKIGQEMKIKVDETGNVYTGKIHEISAEVDPASRTFELKVCLENADRQLSAGWSGQLVRTKSADSNLKQE